MSLQDQQIDAARVQGWIGEFLRTIEIYEQQTAQFDPAECQAKFEQIERLVAGCESLADARLVDTVLLVSFEGRDPGTSDLRTVATHLLVLLHNFLANRNQGADQAYHWSMGVRFDAARDCTDAEFLQRFILPMICASGAFGGHLGLALSMLERVANLENMQYSPVWADDNALALANENPIQIAYQLARRHLDGRGIELVKQAGSLEQLLRKDGSFRVMRQKHGSEVPVLVHLIETYEYDKMDPWWPRLKRSVSAGFRGAATRMAGPYVAYEFTRRNGAFVVQFVAMVATVFFLFLGLYGLNHFQEQRLQELDDDRKYVIDTLLADQVTEIERRAEDEALGLGSEGLED